MTGLHALDYLRQALQSGHSEKELLFSAAEVYNQLGETGSALEWLTKAVQAGYSTNRIRDLPSFQNLVDNPQYQKLVSQSNAPLSYRRPLSLWKFAESFSREVGGECNQIGGANKGG